MKKGNAIMKKNSRIITLFLTVALLSCMSFQLHARQQLAQNVSSDQINNTIDEFDNTIDKSDEIEESDTEEKIVSSSKNISATASPSFFTKAYLTLTPIILVTLNEALGKGIGVATQSFISQTIKRNDFISLKDNLLIKIDEQIKPEFRTTISEKEKLDFAKQEFLSGKEIFKFNKMEETTSFPYILGQTIFIGALNTVILMIGKLAIFGAATGLQTLMPN